MHALRGVDLDLPRGGFTLSWAVAGSTTRRGGARIRSAWPEFRAGEALVFDWTSLAFCCAAAGEISLHPTTLHKAQRSPAYVPLRTAGGPSVFAHRRAYPMLIGRDIAVDCRRRLGVRSFSSSLPPDLGLRTSFGGGPAPNFHTLWRSRGIANAGVDLGQQLARQLH